MGFFSAVKKLFGGKKEDQALVRPEDADAPLEQRAGKAAETDASQIPAGTEGSSAAHARQRQEPGAPRPPAPENAEDRQMLVRLRGAEPRLSSWLAIVLEGQEQADERFWQRLRFFLNSLQAPPDEIDAFISDFQAWLVAMDYSWIDEFRSELQYRLALALDLEDEEDERNTLLAKLTAGLERTRAQLGRRLDQLLSGASKLDASFWEELEELFIMSDMGHEAAVEVVDRLRERARKGNISDPEAVRGLLQQELEEIFRQPRRIMAINPPEVILMIGVNGVGKTTTIAKLAYRDKLQGKKVLICAADTFRAAAIEQLEIWARRAGVEFYAREQGSDPAAVTWQAIEHAQKNGFDTVYVDTAGRLQNKRNLMEELGKIRQVAAKKHAGAPHRSVLVLDATTGQNALSQAKLFRETAGADELILTKLDGTAKGGVAIAVAMAEKLPITYVGLGEKMEDLRPFSGEDFAKALLER